MAQYGLPCIGIWPQNRKSSCFGSPLGQRQVCDDRSAMVTMRGAFFVIWWDICADLIGDGRPLSFNRWALPMTAFFEIPNNFPIAPAVNPSSQSFLSRSIFLSVQPVTPHPSIGIRHRCDDMAPPDFCRKSQSENVHSNRASCTPCSEASCRPPLDGAKA